MRSHFDEQLAQLNKELIEMGALCEEIIALASKALSGANGQMAKKSQLLTTRLTKKKETSNHSASDCFYSNSPLPET